MEVKLKAFAVLDVKSDVFSPPFFMQTVAQARRAFEATVNDPESQISKFPDDFKLVVLGEFDAVRGVLTATEPYSLGFASEFKGPVSFAAPDVPFKAVS